MVPAHPPFPTASNFLFHPDSGIQISTLISESLDGLSVAAMRQNAGRSRNAPPAAGPVAGAGGMNAPASTTRASVMVVLGSAIDVRLSHDAAASSARLPIAVASKSAHSPPVRIFMARCFQ